MSQELDYYDFLTIEELREECRRLEAATDPVSLYEVKNGQAGKKSYVRLYVWAESMAQAKDLALRSYRKFGFSMTELEDLKFDRMFFRGAAPFATKPSDEGFDFADPDTSAVKPV